MPAALPITVPGQLIAAFCRRNHIRKLSLFGSVLTPRFGPDSDVDVLVEFEPDHIPGLFGVARMERGLSGLFGKWTFERPQIAAVTFATRWWHPRWLNMSPADRVRLEHMLEAARDALSFVRDSRRGDLA